VSAPVCELCGRQGDDVRLQLAWFREKKYGPVQDVRRCLDHAACRARVEQGGDPWPLAVTFDEVDRPLPFVEPAVPAVVEAEPEPESQEARPWFS
jgi:hypothetical protein